MFFDPLYIIMILPAMLLALWAQGKVKYNLNKFAGAPTQRGMTGAQVAAKMLADQGIRDVTIRDHLAAARKPKMGRPLRPKTQGNPSVAPGL